MRNKQSMAINIIKSYLHINLLQNNSTCIEVFSVNLEMRWGGETNEWVEFRS